jgi:hypothetical protein
VKKKTGASSVNISDHAYEVIRNRVAPQWPSVYKVKALRKQINMETETNVYTKRGITST